MSFDVPNYQATGISSVLPFFSRIDRAIKIQDIVRKRDTMVFKAPQASYSPSGNNNKIIIQISSQSDYLKPDASALHFKIALSGTNQYLDDYPATCVLNELVVKCQGRVLERIQNLNELVYAQSVLLMSANDMKHEYANLLGAWKWNEGYAEYTSTLATAGYNPSTNSAADIGTSAAKWSRINDLTVEGASQRATFAPTVQKNTAHASRGLSAGTMEYVVPMSMLSGLHRKQELFPLLNSNLDYEFTLESVQKACHVDDATGYTLSNVSMTHDIVQVHPMYNEMIQALINSPEGLVYPINTYEVISSNRDIVSGSKTTWDYSSSARLVKSMLVWRKKDAHLNGQAYHSISSLISNCQQIQIRLGSSLYPNEPLDTPMKIYAHNLKQSNNLGLVSANLGIQNMDTFTSGALSTDTATGQNGTFCFLQNFEKVNESGSYIELDSISLSDVGSKFSIETQDYYASDDPFRVHQRVALEKVVVLRFANGFIDIPN